MTESDTINEITSRVMIVLEQYPYAQSRKAIDILYLTAKTMDKREDKKTVQ